MNDAQVYRYRDAWINTILPLLGLIAAVTILYWPTASAIVSIWWRSETFAHAFFVPPLVVWMAWRLRAQLFNLEPRPSLLILIPILAFAAIWFLGRLVAANSLAQFGFVAILILLVPLILGIPVGWRLAFPLCFAFFAVPFGEFALPTLMDWTANFTVGALRLSGVPVYREGLRFFIPSGSWSVVEACGGIRYLIASFMIGSLYAYLNYKSISRRMVFISVSILLPIFANWVRAYLIVMLAHFSGNRLATGADHIVYGWIFFGLVIMIQFVVGARWAEPEQLDVKTSFQCQLPLDSHSKSSWPTWFAVGSAMLIVCVPFMVLHMAKEPDGEVLNTRQILPWKAEAGWVAKQNQHTPWAPDFHEPSFQVSRMYSHPAGGSVGVHIIYYAKQLEDAKLISSNNVIVRTEDVEWNTLSTGYREIKSDGSKNTLLAREITLIAAEHAGQSSRARLRVWLIYLVDGHWTSSDSVAKLAAAWARLSGRRDGGAAVMIYSLEDQRGDADSSLQTFWRDNRTALEAQLAAVTPSIH